MCELHAVADLGWFPGFHGTSHNAYYTMTTSVGPASGLYGLDGTPYLMNSKLF